MGYDIPADHHGGLPTREPAKRAPRSMTWEAVYKVKYVQADSFEKAKEVAREFVMQTGAPFLKTASAFASRECDGSYTVEFR